MSSKVFVKVPIVVDLTSNLVLFITAPFAFSIVTLEYIELLTLR